MAQKRVSLSSGLSPPPRLFPRTAAPALPRLCVQLLSETPRNCPLECNLEGSASLPSTLKRMHRLFIVLQLLALAVLLSAQKVPRPSAQKTPRPTSTKAPVIIESERPSRSPTEAPSAGPTEVYGISLAHVAPAVSFSMFSSPFDGATKFTYGAMMDPPTEFMTVTLWIKTTDAIGSLVQMGSPRGSPGDLDGEWSLMVYNGKLHYSEYGGGAPADGIVLWSTSKVDTSEYVHVAVVKNGKTGSMYVNGVLEATQTSPVLSIAQNTLVNIGNDAFNSNQYFTGTMDQLMIYKEAFTDEQVRAMYFSAKTFQTCLPISNSWLASSPSLLSVPETTAYFLNHASFDGSNKIYYPTLARAPTTEMTLSFWLRTTTTTETV
ncbi:LamG domain-containing protein, partial [archaeon]